MKTHHNQAPAGNNQPGCSVQSSFQFAQFVVDRNPQSLKSAGCRINADGRFVNDRINEFGQFTGCFYRLKLARGGNFGRNLPGFAFFAVFVDQICQFFFRHTVDNVGGSSSVARHPHIERRVF